jgi:hypothetical protein
MRAALWIASVGLIACGHPARPAADAGYVTDVTLVQLPQAVSGGLWADPAAYPTIPLHVLSDGHPRAVTVTIDGDATTATDAAADTKPGAYTAQVAVDKLSEGLHVLVADADGIQAMATLGISYSGKQWTRIDIDHDAATPLLHRVGEHMYLTWSDGSTGPRVAWLQELDGAGQAIGSKVALAGGTGQPDVLYARTAFGASSIGVLYQQPGGPYVNFVSIVGLDGTPILAPVALDPTGRYGSYGGDITFGAGGYDLTWRTNDGMGHSDVRWLHVDEATRTQTGPVVVAVPGNDDPHGGFDPIYDVAIHDDGTSSLVSFKRYEWNAALAIEIAKCQLATLQGGAVVNTDLAEIGTGYYWDDDCRIRADGTSPVLVWARKDLSSTAMNPPDDLRAARVMAGALDANRENGLFVLSAPESREEPFIVATSATPVLAWTDSRSYNGGTTGQVQLYATAFRSDLTAGTEVLFAHTHLIESTAGLNGVAAGSNAILTWIDERHGGTVVSPQPEVYLETVWQ